MLRSDYSFNIFRRLFLKYREVPAALFMHLNNPENQRIQQEYRAMPPCTSVNTFVLCVRGKRKWMRAGCWGFWACVILLTRIQIHRRRALSPQSAHHIKAPGFAGLQTVRFFFSPPSHLFSFLSVRTGFPLLWGVHKGVYHYHSHDRPLRFLSHQSAR